MVSTLPDGDLPGGSTARKRGRVTKRVLNVRLVIGTLVALTVLGTAAYFWRSHYVRVMFLERAEDYKDEGKWREAAQCLFQHQQLVPDDTNTLIDLAETFDKTAQLGSAKQRAVDLYSRAVAAAASSQEPEIAAKQPELRSRLAELQLEVKRYDAAIAEARKLDASDPARLRVCILAVYTQYRRETLTADESILKLGTIGKETATIGKGSDKKIVRRLLKKALKDNPRDVRLAATVARIYRDWKGLLSDTGNDPSKKDSDKEDLDKLADKVMDAVVEANREKPESLQEYADSLFSRYHYKKLYGLPDAEQDLKDTIEKLEQVLAAGVESRKSDAVDTLLQAARFALGEWSSSRGQGAADEKIEFLRKAVECLQCVKKAAPSDERAYQWLGQLYWTEPRVAPPNDGTGRITKLGKPRGLFGGKSAHIVLDGFNNDFVITPVASQSAAKTVNAVNLVFVNKTAKGDEAIVAFDEAAGTLRVDIDPKRTTANTVVNKINAGGRFTAALDNTVERTDHAIKIWQDGLRACDNNSILLNSYLAEVLIGRGQLKKAENALRTLDRVIQKRGPKLSKPRRLALERSADLLRARLLAAKGEYLAAIPLLRKVASGGRQAASTDPQARQAWQLLGQVYAATNMWRQAADAYDQVATAAPDNARARLNVAVARNRAGDFSGAIGQYQRALGIEDSAETWLALAMAQFQHQRTLKTADRQWGPFQQALDKARNPNTNKPLSNLWRADLLDADYTIVRAAERAKEKETPEDQKSAFDQGINKAIECLRAAEQKHGDSAGLMERLVVVYQRLEHPDDADRALGKLETLAPKTISPYMSRARLYSSRAKYDEAREVLRKSLEALPPRFHGPLRQMQVQVSLEEGKLDLAKDQLLKLHKQHPSSGPVVRRLIELALQENDFGEAKRWENVLSELEGPSGLNRRYYKARRLLMQTKNREDPLPLLEEAADLLTQILARRPEWSEIHRLMGLVRQSQGNSDQAAQSYEEAIRLGAHQLPTYERLIGILYGLQRFDAADDYLVKAQDRGLDSKNLRSLAIDVKARTGNLDEAVSRAQVEVDKQPDDPLARVRYGQLLERVLKPQDAEKQLKQAVELAPNDVRMYNALFAFYVRRQQLDQARKTLEELADKAELSETQMALVLADGYETLGDRRKAETHYREATELAPKNVAIHMLLANFLANDDTGAAEDVLRDVLDFAPDSGNAQRGLAMILNASNSEKDWQEALQILGSSGSEEETQSHRRLQTQLLLRRGGKKNLQKARQIAQELVDNPRHRRDNDRLLLARVFEAQDDLAKASSEYLTLVERDKPDPRHLAQYIEMLLRNDMEHDVKPWLDKLDKQVPDSLDALALRSRWIKAKGAAAEKAQGDTATEETKKATSEEIKQLVESLANKLSKDIEEDKQAEAQLALRVGNLYSSVQEYELAEPWYRRLGQLMPERFGLLAGCIAQQEPTAKRQDPLSEAIDLCLEAARSDDSTRPAITAATLLASGQPGEKHFSRAEPLLAKAAEEHNSDIAFILTLANARVVQQRVDDAEKLYRRILDLDAKHLLALNNIATLLSEQPGKRDEALKYIDKAIGIAGQQPQLLDTKGTILIYKGELKQAVPLLEKAVSGHTGDPRFHLHLADAYYQTHEIEKARNALKAAEDASVDEQILTQKERSLLAELRAKLK